MNNLKHDCARVFVMRSLREGFLHHLRSIKSGFVSDIFESNKLIGLYSKHGLLQDARKLFDEMPERNVFTWNSIISAYIKSHNLARARELFDRARCRDLVTYNSMLSGYVSAGGHEDHALELFYEMRREHESIRIDDFTLTTMLKLSAKLEDACCGKQLHSFMVKTGNDSNGFAVSSLVDMYSKCGCFEDACRVFSGCGVVIDLVSKNAMVAACCREGEMEMALNLFWRDLELNDVMSWNTLISGCAHNGYEEESLKLFVCMAEDGVRWNEHTFASVLSACSSLKNTNLAKEVHAWVLKNGLTFNPFISSGIVDVYSKCGNMKYAESTNAAIGSENAFSVTSMIVGYSSQGNMVEARRLFDSLSVKNSVVWKAMFSGYTKSRQYEAVFELLQELKTKEAITPGVFILPSVLRACTLRAALDPGKQIHAYILRMGIERDEKLISSVVDMYSKCGSITYAERVFHKVAEQDSILYNVMIAGYAHHGKDIEAIKLFNGMLVKQLKPDEVTFIALLSACRHCGLVELGEKYFNSMTEDYNILPEIDHYACMIDLYGRANQLEKAVALMKRVPVKLDAVIWGTFLNACKINGNAEFAREVEEELARIEGDNGAHYVQLANVYAAEGNWAEMGRIRKKMRGKELKRLAGCSWVYLDSKTHVFTSGDRSHLGSEDIYSTLVHTMTDLNNLEDAPH